MLHALLRTTYSMFQFDIHPNILKVTMQKEGQTNQLSIMLERNHGYFNCMLQLNY